MALERDVLHNLSKKKREKRKKKKRREKCMNSWLMKVTLPCHIYYEKALTMLGAV